MKLLLLILALSACESANILGIFNYPSYSHQIVFQKIVKDLSLKGHHLTILTVNRINENYPNVTEIYMEGSYDENIVNYADVKEQKFGILSIFGMMYKTTIKRTLSQLEHPEVKRLVGNAGNLKFDLILLEYLYQHPLIYFAEVFDCPIVAVSSMEATSFVHSIMGNYVNFAVHPETFFSYEHGKLTFLERLWSLTANFIISTAMLPGLVVGDLVAKSYFPNVTSNMREIESNRIEFLLQNANPVLGATRPVTHNTIMLGNLHIEPPKELNFELKNLIDSSINGVIYVSFGSNVKTNYMRSTSLKLFINVFKKLKYDVLWKLDGHHEALLNDTKNIFVSKWYPQADLLAHPKVKLFITHCGLMSLEEAIDREVPMVAIPFLFDQYQNSYTVRNEKIGMYVEYDGLTEKKLYEAIMEVTRDEYKQNIKQFKALMYDFPIKSREKAVWWIEYALRNKGRNRLKYSSAQIPFYQKHGLDVGVFIVLAIFIAKKVLNFVTVKKLKME